MATAQVLANRGHWVVATDRSAISGSEGIRAHVLDVTSDDSVARCLKEVGPLDAIVNNAAIFEPRMKYGVRSPVPIKPPHFMRGSEVRRN
jgi:NAD(P)-dependent dehydrogenase (short-subunit alcohol dehydrogenase family)